MQLTLKVKLLTGTQYRFYTIGNELQAVTKAVFQFLAASDRAYCAIHRAGPGPGRTWRLARYVARGAADGRNRVPVATRAQGEPGSTPATHNATRHGKHSGELLQEPKGPVAVLENMILEAAKSYQAEMGVDGEHPFLADPPKRLKLTVWSVRVFLPTFLVI